MKIMKSALYNGFRVYVFNMVYILNVIPGRFFCKAEIKYLQ